MRRARHVARIGEERKVYKVLVGKPEGKRPLERPRSRWEDGMRMDLRETGLGGVDWIRLAQDTDRCECGDETSASCATELVFHKVVFNISVNNLIYVNISSITITLTVARHYKLL
jgi:hypothetical protein